MSRKTNPLHTYARAGLLSAMAMQYAVVGQNDQLYITLSLKCSLVLTQVIEKVGSKHSESTAVASANHGQHRVSLGDTIPPAESYTIILQRVVGPPLQTPTGTQELAQTHRIWLNLQPWPSDLWHGHRTNAGATDPIPIAADLSAPRSTAHVLF